MKLFLSSVFLFSLVEGAYRSEIKVSGAKADVEEECLKEDADPPPVVPVFLTVVGRSWYHPSYPFFSPTLFLDPRRCCPQRLRESLAA